MQADQIRGLIAQLEARRRRLNNIVTDEATGYGWRREVLIEQAAETVPVLDEAIASLRARLSQTQQESPEEEAREIIAGYHKALGYPGGLNLAAYVGPDGLVARITAALEAIEEAASAQSASRGSALEEALRDVFVKFWAMSMDDGFRGPEFDSEPFVEIFEKHGLIELREVDPDDNEHGADYLYFMTERGKALSSSSEGGK